MLIILKEALKYIVPSSKREGFCMVPTVTWEDVGALKGIKEELQETIIVCKILYIYVAFVLFNFHLSSVIL